MVAMKVTADVTGLQAAAVRMMEALQLQAVEAVEQVATHAQVEAQTAAPQYAGVHRTSVNRRTGRPYVIAQLLKRQIQRGDVAVQGTRTSVPVGLLPATGVGRQMAPYWRLINDGRASRNWAGKRRIWPRPGTKALMFPRAAWRSPEVKLSASHGLRRGGYTFDYVDWPGVSRPHWFMQRGFGKAMARSYGIMQRSMGAAMRSWGQR